MRFAWAFFTCVLLPLAAQASCPASTFGAEEADTCQRSKCTATTGPPPQEIAAINRGVYAEYVSLDLYTRMTTWLAVDVDRAELIYVQMYPGNAYERLRSDARKQEKEPERVTVRRVGKYTYYVRRLTVSAAKLGEMVCVANVLWKSSGEDQNRAATDIYTGFYLVDGRKARDLGGLGIPARDAKKLEGLMDSAKDPDWGWWDVFK